MYTKFLYTKCIPYFDKFLDTFYIQNLADIVLSILYKMYTKACRNVVYILYTFCTHFVYISCIHLVQFLYTKRIHSSHVGIEFDMNTASLTFEML